jgi:hypothetical protein
MSKLHNKADDNASCIVGSSLTREEAYCSCVSYFILKVSDSLPIMTLTEEQCNIIQSPAICAVLPKMHMNQQTARSIVFGPSIYGRLNLPNLYCTQGIGQLHLFIGHLRAQVKTGKLIQISMSYVEPLPLTTLQEHLWHHQLYKRIIGPLPNNLNLLGASQRDAIVGDSLSLTTDGSHSPSLNIGSHRWVFASHNTPI